MEVKLQVLNFHIVNTLMKLYTILTYSRLLAQWLLVYRSQVTELMIDGVEFLVLLHHIYLKLLIQNPLLLLLLLQLILQTLLMPLDYLQLRIQLTCIYNLI
jgi:hypothetical protein